MPPEESSSPEGRPSVMMKIAGPEEVRIGGAGSIVAICVLGVITAFLTILVALARRRAAIERNKVKLLEEEVLQMKEQEKLAENEKIRDQALSTIRDLEADVKRAQVRIAEHDKKAQEAVAKIKEATSWDELFKD
jgi:hypothetical protein